jgi:hypothetical protein
LHIRRVLLNFLKQRGNCKIPFGAKPNEVGKLPDILPAFTDIGIMRFCRFLLLLVVALALLLLPSCRQYYLSVCQEWVDVRYLASTNVHTPDPRQDHPPIGQMLILDWRIPKDLFSKKPEIVLDLILWDYTATQIRIPIKRRMDFATYRLFNEDYEKTGGILTYKAVIITENGKIFREWKHQLWVNLITVSDEKPENQSAPAGSEESVKLAE